MIIIKVKLQDGKIIDYSLYLAATVRSTVPHLNIKLYEDVESKPLR